MYARSGTPSATAETERIRTFISLRLGDGARSDILRWVTHSRPRTATIDDYTTLVWNPLCDEVAKLRIELRRPTETTSSVILVTA